LEKQLSIEKENSLLNNKIIYDITQFTHLDYPDHLACIFWFSSCNMQCDFCYNKDIVYAKGGNFSMYYALEFLKTRVNLLDGVVLSGGEASSYNLKEFCLKIKELGFLIKLDTNGTNYEKIKELVQCNLVDFIALDYKAPHYKFTQITKSNKFSEFSQTLNLLIKNDIAYEVRTTLHPDLLTYKDINNIIEDLVKRGYTNSYFLQEFLETQNIGNIKQSAQKFQYNLLSNRLKVEYRYNTPHS